MKMIFIASIKKTLLVLSTFFLLSALASASSADLATLLNGVRTMRADFTQTTYDNHGKVAVRSYGNMALNRPGKFRWEIKKPIPQLIVASGTRLWIYDPDLEQVTIRALHQAAGESPAMLLSQENAAIDKDYVVTKPQNTPAGQEWFKLTPRNADSMLANVQMGFQNKELREMRLEDHLGHTTRIQFQRSKTNVDLPAALFTFKKPAKVDVIDETRR